MSGFSQHMLFQNSAIVLYASPGKVNIEIELFDFWAHSINVIFVSLSLKNIHVIKVNVEHNLMREHIRL